MAKVLSRFVDGMVSEIDLGNGDEIRVGCVNPIINGEEQFGVIIGITEDEGKVSEILFYEEGEGWSLEL